MMINTEYLAISAIFITGLYIGFKVKNLMIEVENYIKDKKKFE